MTEALPDPTWLSLLPPVIAIATALATRQVVLSLFSGIWIGWTILDGGNPLAGLRDALDSIVDVFTDRGNALILIFSGLIGSLIALTQRSGGVEGFVSWIVGRGIVRTKRSAQLLPVGIGLLLFLESNLTCLISGAIARPVFDRFQLSREKLAFLCDATAAPVCVLFPFNAYGAVIVGLLATQQVEDPLGLFVASIPFNLYALLIVVLTVIIAYTGRDWGPMATAERRARETGKLLRDGATPLVSDEVMSLPTKEGLPPRARFMVVPMIVLLATVLLGLRATDGDGSTAIFWGMCAAVATASALAIASGALSLRETLDLTMRGIGGLVPVLVLVLFAFSLGATTRELQAGLYLSRLSEGLVNPLFVPAILFVMSAAMSFATGTSWGTFAIMLPIGVPMASVLGIDPRVMVGAVVGGSIFGDHCSPISDTTIVASLAAGSDHIDHVATQLPYALVTGAATAVLLTLASLWL